MRNLRNILSAAAIVAVTFLASCNKDDDGDDIEVIEDVLSEYAYKNDSILTDGTISRQRIKIANNETIARMNGATEWTIEAWIKPQSEANLFYNQEVVRRWDQFNFTMYSKGRIYLTVKDGSGSSTYINTNENVITGGVWQHVAAICDGASIKIYVDGVDVTREAYPAMAMNTMAADGSSNGYIGYGGTANTRTNFIGEIDGVRVIAKSFNILDLNTTDVEGELYATSNETAMLFNFEKEFETIGAGTADEKVVTVNDADEGEALVQYGGVRVAL